VSTPANSEISPLNTFVMRCESDNAASSASASKAADDSLSVSSSPAAVKALAVLGPSHSGVGRAYDRDNSSRIYADRASKRQNPGWRVAAVFLGEASVGGDGEAESPSSQGGGFGGEGWH